MNSLVRMSESIVQICVKNEPDQRKCSENSTYCLRTFRLSSNFPDTLEGQNYTLHLNFQKCQRLIRQEEYHIPVNKKKSFKGQLEQDCGSRSIGTIFSIEAMDPNFTRIPAMSTINTADNVFSSRLPPMPSSHFPSPYFANLYSENTPSFASVKSEKGSINFAIQQHLQQQQQQQQQAQQQQASQQQSQQQDAATVFLHEGNDEGHAKDDSTDTSSSSGTSNGGENGTSGQPALKKKWFTSYTNTDGGSTVAKAETLSTMRKWFSKYGSRASKPKGPKQPRQPRTPKPKLKKLECEECGKEFSYPFDLRRHQRVHTGEKPYGCDQCGRAFSQATHLAAHRRTHLPKNITQCSICEMQFTSYESLLAHTKVHTSKRRRVLECEECGKEFVFASELKRHQRTHTGEKPFKCPACGRGFSQLSHVQTHQKTSCKGVPYVPKHTSGSSKRKNKKTKTTSTSCQTGSPPAVLTPLSPTPISAMTFNSSSLSQSTSLQSAFSTISPTSSPFHTTIQVIPPTLPTMVPPPSVPVPPGIPQYQTFQQTSTHLPGDSKRKKSKKSELAGQVTASSSSSANNEGTKSSSSQTHSPSQGLRVKLNKATQMCDVCQKEFRYMSALQRHMRTHTGERPFDCHICGKTFAQTAHLNKHKAKHSGIDEDLAIIRAASSSIEKDLSQTSHQASQQQQQTQTQTQTQQTQQQQQQGQSHPSQSQTPTPTINQQQNPSQVQVQQMHVLQAQMMPAQLQMAMPMTLQMQSRGPFFYHQLNPEPK